MRFLSEHLSSSYACKIIPILVFFTIWAAHAFRGSLEHDFILVFILNSFMLSSNTFIEYHFEFKSD